MAEENQKNEVRVEDRRHFDKEGNPIKPEEAEKSSPEPEKQTEKSSPEPQKEGDKASQEPEKPPQQKASAGKLPPMDFPSLIFVYMQTALIHLGELPDPVEGKTIQDFESARQIIDIVELLREKTKGNLTPQEDQYIEKVLF